MNTLKGQISSVETKGALSLVTVQVGQNSLTSIVIDTSQSAPFLKKGKEVRVIFKETEVIIARSENYNLSIQNQLPGTVLAVEEGELLSKVMIQIDTDQVSSIITTEALKALDLKPGQAVKALIKTNEIMLSE